MPLFPVSTLFRLTHKLTRNKPHRDENFNKQLENTSSCDITFLKDNYFSFHFVKISFTTSDLMNDLPNRLLQWTKQHFDIKPNITMIDNNTPRQFIHHCTF
jgi:hypothetical protein